MGMILFFAADKEIILDRFLAMNIPGLFAAETNLYSHPKLRDQFPPSPTRFRYLNTGTYIGYVGYLRQLFENISPISPSECDQAQMITYYLAGHQDEIYLDYHCELFFPLYGLKRKHVRVSGKKVHSVLTGSTPCVIHGNGNSASLYRYIFYQLFE